MLDFTLKAYLKIFPKKSITLSIQVIISKITLL